MPASFRFWSGWRLGGGGRVGGFIGSTVFGLGCRVRELRDSFLAGLQVQVSYGGVLGPLRLAYGGLMIV